jgi:hypothetical protein
MKTIFLIDHCSTGHHSTYIKLLAKSLLQLGCQVVVFFPAAEEINKWIIENNWCQNNIQCLTFNLPSSCGFPVAKLQTMFDTIANWQATKKSVEMAISLLSIQPDLIFFAWLDTYLHGNLVYPIIDSIFPYPWTGLYFQPSHLRFPPKYPWLRLGPLNPSHILKSTNCKGVAILDEGVIHLLKASTGNIPVLPFPDFTDTSTPDNRFEVIDDIKEKANNRCIVASIGILQKRKGFLTLVEIAKQNLSDNCFFLFAGELDRNDLGHDETTNFLNFVNTNPKNCYFHLERIPDESKFNAIISITDIIYVVYDYAYSSNLLTKAAFFKKYVVASNKFCIGERVKKYSLGLTASPGSVEESLLAINKLSKQIKNGLVDFSPEFQEYQQIHSVDNLYFQMQNLFSNIYNNSISNKVQNVSTS